MLKPAPVLNTTQIENYIIAPPPTETFLPHTFCLSQKLFLSFPQR